jgi:ABC-type molybdate transport system substrate-binding protein
MATSRRRLLGGLPSLVLAAAAAPVRADSADLVVTCDTTLAPVLRAVGSAYAARSGVHVYVFPTGPGLIVPQLVRDIQNDIVVTQVTTLAQAERAGVIASATTGRSWRNRLVVAGARGASATDGTLAVSDPSPASDIDGPALVARLGLQPAHVLGAVDTDEVAYLVTSGAAQAGLLHMTDVRADRRLEVIREVPAQIRAPVLYAASVTHLARRPNPEGFIGFLATVEANAILTEGGLETGA